MTIRIDTDFIEAVRMAALEGMTPSEIARQLGLTYQQFARVRRAYPEVEEAVQSWLEHADDKVERALYRNALEGNVRAQIAWLSARRPERWLPPESSTRSNAATLIVTGVGDSVPVVNPALPAPDGGNED